MRCRVGDRYDDVELPWPDTKLATFLCIGGPCKYKIKKDSGIDNSFIKGNYERCEGNLQ